MRVQNVVRKAKLSSLASEVRVVARMSSKIGLDPKPELVGTFGEIESVPVANEGISMSFQLI